MGNGTLQLPLSIGQRLQDRICIGALIQNATNKYHDVGVAESKKPPQPKPPRARGEVWLNDP